MLASALAQSIAENFHFNYVIQSEKEKRAITIIPNISHVKMFIAVKMTAIKSIITKLLYENFDWMSQAVLPLIVVQFQ